MAQQQLSNKIQWPGKKGIIQRRNQAAKSDAKAAGEIHSSEWRSCLQDSQSPHTSQSCA